MGDVMDFKLIGLNLTQPFKTHLEHRKQKANKQQANKKKLQQILPVTTTEIFEWMATEVNAYIVVSALILLLCLALFQVSLRL